MLLLFLCQLSLRQPSSSFLLSLHDSNFCFICFFNTSISSVLSVSSSIVLLRHLVLPHLLQPMLLITSFSFSLQLLLLCIFLSTYAYSSFTSSSYFPFCLCIFFLHFLFFIFSFLPMHILHFCLPPMSPVFNQVLLLTVASSTAARRRKTHKVHPPLLSSDRAQNFLFGIQTFFYVLNT